MGLLSFLHVDRPLSKKSNQKLSISTKRKKIIPTGCQEFHFEDGFSCIARNIENANKKHLKYLYDIQKNEATD